MSDFFRKNFVKPQLVPLVFIVVSTIVLMFLGFWQLERLTWKNNLLAEIERAQAEPALPALPSDLHGLDYRKVTLSGAFDYDKVLHLIGPQIGTSPGFYMLTPFVLEDGRVILINRGFSPPDKETKPSGTLTINGIIRPARIKRYFAPENIVEKNVWFHEDITAMEAFTGLALLPVIIEPTDPTPPGEFPINGKGKIHLKNDHLGYAITWFTTAIIGIIMFGFYHRKPK